MKENYANVKLFFMYLIPIIVILIVHSITQAQVNCWFRDGCDYIKCKSEKSFDSPAEVIDKALYEKCVQNNMSSQVRKNPFLIPKGFWYIGELR